MEKILQVDATITTRYRLQIVRDVYEKLDTNYKNKLSESCFGSFLRLKNIKLALQIWAFEVIPTLGMKFGTKYPNVIPRMVAWKILKRLTSATIDNVLNSKELEVNSTLIPTKIEVEEAYWKELKPIVEEDESVSNHSEEDEAEHDTEPQHAYHEESSSTITAWLVELDVTGRFHPGTSAFDGATSSTAYVLENEPKDGLEKEVGFDDVTDVHAAQRKVDLP
ncbi:Hypothetical predicted protein [Olea europaea subsp. europaea]|uniref:Uncharacterized protein n=1 Tax=Olea europaea subsp. europaea TaxID=158383 RepID=A0A8S0UTY9_OLEEU|nr:Hypothetical predicted protein [Olea europaea subsp. europaea]